MPLSCFRPTASKSTSFTTLIFNLLLLAAIHTLAADPHVIKFRSPSLYPEGLTWDPSAQHFIVGSLHHRTFLSVSDAAVVNTLLSDPSLPPNSTILGLAVDSSRRRLLAAIHSLSPLPPFNALAAYDLRSFTPIFLSPLPSDPSCSSSPDVANDVAVDFDGNAYVTNSGNNFIWKVNVDGEPSVFSKSPLFTKYPPVDPTSAYNSNGLNGVAYSGKGYLLVVQSNTGKMFKVDAVDGRARVVILKEDLASADDVVIRKDGVVVVVSGTNGAWFLKSHDSWGEGAVIDRIALDRERFPTSAAVGGGDRVYVVYGHLLEGINGNVDREWFSIEEIRTGGDGVDDNIWMFVLIGLGFAYFLFWRFQMGRLVKEMNKKRA